MTKKKDAEQPKLTGLDKVIATANTQCGPGTCVTGRETKRDPPRLPFGVFAVDYAAGGGIPIGGTACLWGPECLDGDSVIVCRTTNPLTGKQHSCKRTTLRRLFERFHCLPGGKGRYVRKESVDAVYTVPSVNEVGAVLHNRVLDVVSCGPKNCFEVYTGSGLVLVTSGDHAYMVPGGVFKELRSLVAGDRIMIHNRTPFHGRKPRARYPEVLVKNHPFWPAKIVNGCRYKRGRVNRAAYEAFLNGLTYSQYIELLNKGLQEELEGLHYLPLDVHVHHRNKDVSDNADGNLHVLSPSDHSRGHALENHNKLRFVAVEDTIVSITPVGARQCYDLVCRYPYNNYVANGFVVHNSTGKTSLAINAMATAGSICWRCFNMLEMCSCSKKPLAMRTFWADVEGCLDREWVEAIGVDPDKYVQALADYGEQYINLCVAALQADDCGLVVIDSLAALTPAAEMEAAAEDDFMALQPRMIGRAVRVMKQHLIREGKRGHPCTVLFVNQLRFKIGQMFGDKETMSGGKAMMHEFSLLLRCGKRVFEEKDKGKYISASSKHEKASRQSFTVRKAKVLTLAGTGEYIRIKENLPELGMAKGEVDDFGVMLRYARETEIVTQGSGKKWLYFDHSAKKLDDIKRLWAAKPAERFRTSMEIIRRAKTILSLKVKAR